MQDLMILILGSIALAYAAAAAFVIFILQAFVPKRLVPLRIGLIVVLVGVAIAIPPLYLNRHERTQEAQQRAQRDQVAQECRQASVQVVAATSSPAYFIDLRYLDLLPQRQGPAFTFDDMLVFMLRQRLEALEFPWRQGFLPGELVGRRAATPVVRLHLQREPHAACAGFHAWLRRSPAQGYPPLRLAGLPAGACVAVDLLEEPTARHRVEVAETVLHTDAGMSSWRKRYEVTLRDALEPGQGRARLVEMRAGMGGNSPDWFPCDPAAAAARIATFGQALASPGSALIRPPTEVQIVREPPLAPPLSEARLAQYRWVAQPGETSATNLIAPDGLVWVDIRYAMRGAGGPGAGIGMDAIVLTALVGDELLRLPVQWDSAKAVDVTGLATAGDRIALVAYGPGGRRTAEPVLFELDLKARSVHVSRLDPGQVPGLPVPAAARK